MAWWSSQFVCESSEKIKNIYDNFNMKIVGDIDNLSSMLNGCE